MKLKLERYLTVRNLIHLAFFMVGWILGSHIVRALLR